MNAGLKAFVFGLMLLGSAATAGAYEFELRYYRIEDPALAGEIERADENFESREKPLRDRRRQAAYNTPEHARVMAELEAIQIERDREFLRLLESSPPEVRFSAQAEEGRAVSKSEELNGKRFNIVLTVGARENGRISLEVQADYDGAALYQGGALQIPVGAPHLVSKAFVRLGDESRGSMVFITVRP